MILTRLRSETREDHDRMERDLALLRPDLGLARYRQLLRALHGFLAAWEPLVADRLRDPRFFDPRRKLGLLERDLRVLHVPAGDVCSDMPALDGPAAAMGSLYVLEGATLGGRIILRHVHDVLGLTPATGAAYFASYGASVGEMWRAFQQRLVAGASPSADDKAVAAARATFGSLNAWLAREGCHA